MIWYHLPFIDCKRCQVLKILPTSVRNKMGYMSKGGTPKKANKGMLVITIGSAKKMKKKKKA